MATSTQPKPTAAFAASIIAGLITIFSGFLGTTASAIQLLSGTVDSSIIMIWSTIAGFLTIVGGWLLYNNSAQRKLGSILTLVFSLISANILGLILGLIGGFLGYTFKSSSTPGSSNSGRNYTPP